MISFSRLRAHTKPKLGNSRFWHQAGGLALLLLLLPTASALSAPAEKLELALNTARTGLPCAACQKYEQEINSLNNVAIRVDPGRDPAYDQMRRYQLAPLDLGDEYIGKATLHDYEQAWQRFFKARAEHIKLMGAGSEGETVTNPCNLLITDSALTVHGPSCLPIAGFERVEARFDEYHRLSSIMVVLNIDDTEVQNQLRQLIDLLYLPLDTKQSPLAQVATYIGELNQLMIELSRQQYHFDLAWYQVGANYAYTKFSSYSGHDKFIILYGSERYFTQDELHMVKRRLAIVRQELAQMQRRNPTTMVSQQPTAANPRAELAVPATPLPTPKSMVSSSPKTPPVVAAAH